MVISQNAFTIGCENFLLPRLKIKLFDLYQHRNPIMLLNLYNIKENGLKAINDFALKFWHDEMMLVVW